MWARDFREHPYTLLVDRIAAARWLADSKDFDQAARLLAIGDGAYLIHPSADYATMLSGLIARERARIEEQRGNPDAAREYYQEFLRRYDRPVPAHQKMVEDVRGRVASRGDDPQEARVEEQKVREPPPPQGEYRAGRCGPVTWETRKGGKAPEKTRVRPLPGGISKVDGPA